MLKVGLVGLGFMGHAHLQNYIRLMDEGFPIQLVAICDVDETKHNGAQVEGNLDIQEKQIDFSKFQFYSSMEEMVENEKLDYVDLCLPTYLHAPMAILAMSLGLHVFCEKPMAISSKACDEMIQASQKYGRQLMIGQTLRFFPSYQYVKEAIQSERYGKVVSASFFRGGATPKWSFENWLLQKDKSGGCLLDQHIHDVDTINWLFGKPAAVSTTGKVIFDGSGYDIVSSNYHYEDGKVVNAQDDWTINGDFGFEMSYRINFESGTIILEKGILTDYPEEGAKFQPDINQEDGYYLEIKYFAEAILNQTSPNLAVPLESTRETIFIAEHEQASADLNGEKVSL
ncbi:Gfo/Idh/MocA family protein [Listeria fleischmannii]|uniref:Gfo/Idh/MocA family protein n=1 Tax=Listeria fleischmannii TaxID=1069827 RepID=UPI000254F0FB|nr:Gfo/Idh/MocA family oxidoreductase [Listeria fleischmannii]EIA21065.1 oxidoreductase [Listeria fleischmannii subsp. coloradonensis]STY33737.1 Inositol 2-dehydrogenase [Listeria fleischmannii subsp. coloradonensis]